MTKTVYAHTPPGSDFPPFVNLSRQEDCTYTLTVRSQGNGGRDMGTIKLSPESVEALTTAALDELYRETPAQAQAAPLDLPVIDPGPDSLEREIQAKANKGPRVTPADINAEIAAEFYFTAADGVLGQSEMGTRPAAWTNLDQVTICTLVLRNGAKVLGVNYGAIDRAQHDAGKGREAARVEAVEKIWELLGFRLRDELARPVLTDADAAADLAGIPRPT